MPPVAHHGERRRDRRDDLPRRLVVRRAVGGDPARIAVGAAAAVHLLRPVRAPRLLLEEIEPAPLRDPRVIGDREPRGVPERDGRREMDHQRIAGPVVPQRPTPGRHRTHLEPPLHVEHHPVETRSSGDHRGGHPAVERGRVPVEVLHLDALVDEVVVVGWREAPIHHPLEIGLRGQRSEREQGHRDEERVESHESAGERVAEAGGVGRPETTRTATAGRAGAKVRR